MMISIKFPFLLVRGLIFGAWGSKSRNGPGFRNPRYDIPEEDRMLFPPRVHGKWQNARSPP